MDGTVSPAADVADHAFTDDGPWVVVADELVWRRGLDRIRARTRAEVPRLLARRRLPPIGRFFGVVVEVGLALGTWWWRERGTPVSRAALSRRLREAFERLGSTYVKLGQIVSAFEGLFPDELVVEFKKLRDQVPSERFADIRAVVERDLGRPLEDVFAEFDA